MPFERRGLNMLRDWMPDAQFDAANDRLLVTTSLGETLVVRGGPDDDDGTTFVVDKELIPKNLAVIPREVQMRRVFPFAWDPSVYPWHIFIFDGEMSREGPFIEMYAVGLGWTQTVLTDVTIAHIEPIRCADIKQSQLTPVLRGITFSEPDVYQEAIYEEVYRIS